MSRFHVVIPARYDSQRLPGKPLLDIGGKPMIRHVYERALESGADRVVIATDDARIADAAAGFGAEVCMTSPRHASGTDRIAEVAEQLGWERDELIVNLQGDEPLMPPGLLQRVAGVLEEQPGAAVSTLAVPLQDVEEVKDPNVVKVVCDRNGLALYFSRAPIPWKRGSFDRSTPDGDWTRGMLRHLGIYAYRAGFLGRYVNWAPAPLERDESLEQLRVLWNGERIALAIVDQAPHAGVDTLDDLERVRRMLATAGSPGETP